MRKYRILHLLFAISCVLGIGLIKTQVTAVRNSNVSVVASASQTKSSLRNRIDNFASQRRDYYYPQITYNTRDIGGLRTWNNKYQIRPHMLYRSANLHWINHRGIEEIHQLGIRHDIDLRQMSGPNVSIDSRPQPGEFHKMKSNGINIHYHQYPVENSQQEAYTWPIRKRLGETYRFGYWYTTNPVARRAYHNSIMEIIRNGRNPRRNGALIFNCTQGRDRTGVLSAIVEYLLGVRKANIYNDFLLTNYYKYQSPYTDQITRINRFYHTVHANYGSMWHYARQGLYLSYNNIKTLRHEYLEKI